jgi:hypothetical protein
MTGFNLPDGVTESMLPGANDKPESVEDEKQRSSDLDKLAKIAEHLSAANNLWEELSEEAADKLDQRFMRWLASALQDARATQEIL